MPYVVARVDSKTYVEIIEKAHGSLKKQREQGGEIEKFYPVTIIHEFITDCDQFNFMIFFLIPTIAFTLVLKITYTYRSTKVIRHHQPGRFFKGQEIRVFLKKNLKAAKSMIGAMLTMTLIQSISFLLIYFVCPWHSFKNQSAVEKVLTI